MNNEKITFKGKVRWASVLPGQARKPFEIDTNEPDNCSYSIEVECSKAQFDDLKKKGIPRLTELREDENGTTYIRLRSSKIKGKYTFPDPAVVDSNGAPITNKIANGSEGLVTAELAPIKGRKGTVLRLRTVLITNLISFNDGGNDVKELLAQVNPHALEEGYAQDLNPEPDVSTTDDW